MLAAISKIPDVVRLLAESGAEPMSMTQAQMIAIIEHEAQAMSQLIKAKNITIN